MHWFPGFGTGGLVAFVVGLFVVSFIVVALVRLLPYRSAPVRVKSELFSGDFSEERYAPMVRLLSVEDFEFLASQPGYRPEIALKLRRSRRRIFRLYLRELASDFHRLHARARKMVSESGEEHAALVGVLIRQQLTFWRTMLAIEFRMMTPGLAGGIEVRALVHGIEAMRADVARVAAPLAA